MQNRNPNQQTNTGSALFNSLRNFLYRTSTSSSSSANTIAAAASSSSSASTAAAAAVPASTVVRSPVAGQTKGDFSTIPTDVTRYVLAPMLDVQSLGRLDRTCRGTHADLSLFSGPLLSQKLAHYLVVEPNPAKVIAMIRANPQLLQREIKEVKVNGISIRGYTPFQLAYGACDVNAKEDEGGLCEALEEELARHLGSKEAALAEIQRQIAAKKLNVVDKAKDDLIKNTLAAALNNIIQAISNEQFNRGRDANNKLILNPATLNAINTFRAALAELQPNVVEEGMHFRSNTIQETWDAFAQVAATTWGYDYNKCALFADGALSSVLLSCLPVNDKQRLFGQGYYYLYEQNSKEPFSRHMTVRGSSIKFDDCLLGPSIDFWGLSGSYIDILYGSAVATTRRARRGVPIPRFFKTYVEQKLRAHKTYTAEQPRVCGPANSLLK